jgi:hypothetical protein
MVSYLGPEHRASPRCSLYPCTTRMIFNRYEGDRCPSIGGVSPANARHTGSRVHDKDKMMKTETKNKDSGCTDICILTSVSKYVV